MKTAVEWLENELHLFIHPEHGKDVLSILQQAKIIEEEQHSKYAEFAIRCDRENMKILIFKDWCKLNENTIGRNDWGNFSNEKIAEVFKNLGKKETMKYTKQEIQKIAQAMLTYGGSFMKCIGQALQCADENNTIKILETWSEEVEKYYNFSKNEL